MSRSDSTDPRSAGAVEEPGAAQAEAQRAADGLKDQIAAVRDRIRQAREALTEHARRDAEGRTFKRDRRD